MKLLKTIATGLFFLILATQNVCSQIRPLSIGAQCPDMELKPIFNFPESRARLSDFKGKLIILDFWATWCNGCINQMPKLDSLGREFGNKLQVMLVTHEDSNTVKVFIKKSRVYKTTYLPTITNDTTLKQYFKHNLVPHEVWLDSSMKVLAITSGEDINRENILSYFSGHPPALATKRDFPDFDVHKPLMLGGLGSAVNFNRFHDYRSCFFSGYISGLPGIYGITNTREGYTRVMGINLPIKHLYRLAYIKSYDPREPAGPSAYLSMEARTITEVRDSTKRWWLGYFKKGWNAKETAAISFCFELHAPLADSARIYAVTERELNNYFGERLGIVASLEKRRVPCWALIRTTEKDLINSKGGERLMKIDEDEHTITLKNNYLDSWLLSLIGGSLGTCDIPIINETGYLGKVDLQINANPADPVSIAKGLKPFGLDLIKVERDLDMIVFREKK